MTLSKNNTAAPKAPPPASTADGAEAPLIQYKMPAETATRAPTMNANANHKLRTFGSDTRRTSSRIKCGYLPQDADTLIIAYEHDRTIRSSP